MSLNPWVAPFIPIHLDDHAIRVDRYRRGRDLFLTVEDHGRQLALLKPDPEPEWEIAARRLEDRSPLACKRISSRNLIDLMRTAAGDQKN